MYFRQLLNDETACASYLPGCKSKGKFAVVDPHVDLVDEYIAHAEAQGAEIAAVLVSDIPPAPKHQAEIVAANRAGPALAEQG